MRALQTAATGMAAQELNVQTISNNIANLRTTGFKRQQAQFQDLLYENFKRAGSSTSEQGNIMPAGLSIGSGVKTVSTPRDMSQGNLTSTSSAARATSRSACRTSPRATPATAPSRSTQTGSSSTRAATWWSPASRCPPPRPP